MSQIRFEFQQVWDDGGGVEQLRELLDQDFATFLKLVLTTLPKAKPIALDARIDQHLTVDVALLREIAEKTIRLVDAEKAEAAGQLGSDPAGGNGHRNAS